MRLLASARLLLTGLLFAGTGSLVALSPLGRRSGAHLNPSVTLAFWTQHKVHPHDLAGYVSAQILGAITSVAVLRLAWGHTARALHLAATQPGHGFTALDAAGLECAMTSSLVVMILFMTSSRRTARWTPLGNWLLVATLVWQGAPYTGTSLTRRNDPVPEPAQRANRDRRVGGGRSRSIVTPVGRARPSRAIRTTRPAFGQLDGLASDCGAWRTPAQFF